MEIYSPILFIEINDSEYIFSVGDVIDKEDFKLIYKNIVPLQGIANHKITNFDLAFNTIKKNIYTIEHQLNFTFKETILIINNFERSFVNLSGFKKLNGSQILKENITYILNSLKSYVDENEDNKTILHIVNSKYSLDKKKIENLPIGLFGDFYSHELSFCMINNNDYKNLNNIFNNCHLKIKKILLKSFIEGSLISNKNENLDTFYQIIINENNSQLIYFENNSLKFEQSFDFGSNLVVKDISRVTSIKIAIVKKILNNHKLDKETPDDVLVEKEFFDSENYVKVKKKLIFDIAHARIQELAKLIVNKNINLLSHNAKDRVIFLKISDKLHFKCFEDTYYFCFSNNRNFKVKCIDCVTTDDIIKSANELVDFGWKKEAIPVTHTKKSILAKFFDILFS